MIIAIAILSALMAGVLGFALGVRYEKGTKEIAANLREEEDAKRGARPGTVRLNTIKIRR